MNILLICSAGMSTSLLVRKMQEIAYERHMDAEIWACGDHESDYHIEKADIILVGPQMRFLYNKVKCMAGHRPVEIIDMMWYGTMDGERVLDAAIQSWKEERNA